MSGAPYEPRGSFFDLPGGGVGAMSDIVAPSPTYLARYVAEVKLLQQALGAGPDGIIGPDTRSAARAAYDQRVGVTPATTYRKTT